LCRTWCSRWRRLSPAGGEAAADPRHDGLPHVLWLDGHAYPHTLEQLGYQFESNGSIGLDGDNFQCPTNGLDVPWTPELGP
jgi:prepilin-type processing-associated H-X9-DG protein